MKSLEEKRKDKAEYMIWWRKNNPNRAKEISREANKNFRKDHHKDFLQQNRKHYHKIRMFVWSWFGGKCVRCGFNDWRAFELDHINGDGHLDGNKYDTMNAKYKLIMTDPELAKAKFQLFCANCNKIKQREREEYGNISEE